MSDLLDYASIAVSSFFVVLALVLLAKYRRASQQITSSSDIGRDLWVALETRLSKQDERVLEMMGRLDAIQSRWVPPPQYVPIRPREPTREMNLEPEKATGVGSRGLGKQSLDSIEVNVIRLLRERPRTSVELKALIDRSREHTARTMKALFDRGLVTRDESEKPFVYQLTEAGRSYLS